MFREACPDLITKAPFTMLTSANFGSSTASTMLGNPAAELLLRVRHPQHAGHVIRLRSSKCTIGSAAGCTLRLRAPGIRPLHAWILRSGASSVILCKTPDVLLNGRSVLEAVITAGDILKIGRIELEVLAAQPSKSPTSLPSPQPLPPSFAAAITRVDRARLKKVIDVARQLRSDAASERNRSQSRDADLEQLRSHVHTALTQLTQTQQLHTTEQQAWRTERETLRTNLQNLDNSLHEARTQNSLLRDQMIDAMRRADDAAQKLANFESSREHQSELARSQSNSLVEQAKKFAAQRLALQEQVDNYEQQLSQARCEAVAHSTQLSELVNSLRQQLEAALADKATAGDAAQSQLHQLQQSLALMQQQLTSRDEQISSLTAELHAAREQQAMAAIPAEISPLVTQPFASHTLHDDAEHREQIASLELQLAETSEQLATQSSRTSAAESQLEELRSLVQTLRDEIITAASRDQELSARLAESSSRSSLLETELSALEVQLEEARQVIAEFPPAVPEVPLGLACTLPASSVTSDSIADASELQALQDQLTELTETVSQLERQLESQLNARRLDREEAESRLDMLVAAHRDNDATKSAELEALRTELSQTHQSHAEEIAKLTERLLQAEAQAELLREKLSDTESQLAIVAAEQASLSLASASDSAAGDDADYQASTGDAIMMTAPVTANDLAAFRAAKLYAEQLEQENTIDSQDDESGEMHDYHSAEAIDQFHGLSSTWQFPTRQKTDPAEIAEQIERQSSSYSDWNKDAHHEPIINFEDHSDEVQPVAEQPANIVDDSQASYLDQRLSFNDIVNSDAPVPSTDDDVGPANEVAADNHEPVEDVSSVLARLMNSGVWKSEEGPTTHHDSAPPHHDDDGSTSEASRIDDRFASELPAEEFVKFQLPASDSRSLRAQFLGEAASESEAFDAEQTSDSSGNTMDLEAGGAIDDSHDLQQTGEDVAPPSAEYVHEREANDDLQADEPNENYSRDGHQSRPATTDSWRDRIAQLQQEDDDESAGLPPVHHSPLGETGLDRQASMMSSVMKSAPAATSGGDEDESIEDYMARLLKRVRGDGVADHGNTGSAKPTPTAAKASAAQPTAPVKPIEPMQPINADEFIPRCAAPEQTSDLAAMRELANSAARSAISSHAKKSGAKASSSRLNYTVLTGVTTVALFSWAVFQGSIYLVALAAAGLILTCILGGSAVIRSLDRLRLAPPTTKPNKVTDRLDQLSETVEIPPKNG